MIELNGVVDLQTWPSISGNWCQTRSNDEDWRELPLEMRVCPELEGFVASGLDRCYSQAPRGMSRGKIYEAATGFRSLHLNHRTLDLLLQAGKTEGADQNGTGFLH